jgi:ABC-type transport system involved in multi-copper enzyme maturation permease subunit
MSNNKSSYLLPFIRAEVAKLWALPIVRLAVAISPVAMYLFVAEVYHIDKLPLHASVRNLFDALPWVLFDAWKTLFLQMFIVSLAAYAASVESQYGMIRLLCAQPLSRTEYVLGKGVAISIHVTALTLVFLGSAVAWTALYSGVQGVSWADLSHLAIYTLALLILVQALGWTAYSLGLLRRTIGGSLITAFGFFILLTFAAAFSSDRMRPYFLVRYIFFPWKYFPRLSSELRSIVSLYTSLTLLNLLLAALMSSGLALAIGYVSFVNRDITE